MGTVQRGLGVIGGVVVLIVFIWLVIFVLKMIILLLPLALVALIGYLAFRYLKKKAG